MSKKDPVLIALGECPEKWDRFLLKTNGYPQDPSTRKEIQQDSIRIWDQKSGRLVPVPLDAAGESATQGDALLSLHKESAANEGAPLSPEWLCYLEYMDVIAEALHPKDKGATLKRTALADARSRHWEKPPDVFRPMNASLGTPAKFRERWTYGELEIRARAASRRNLVIEVWRLPPDEPEDEAGEPSGHWNGLTWTSAPNES